MSVQHEGFAVSQDKIPIFQRMARTHLGIAIMLTYFLVAFSYVGTHLGPLLILVLLRVNPMWYRRFVDWGIGVFLSLSMFGIEIFFGIRPKRYGYKGKFDRRCILLMNHRCHLDWFFLWSIVARQGDLSSWKPMMKGSLKKIPLLGWLVQFPMHIFLKRKWEHDEQEVLTKLHFFNALDYPIQLLLFPDGADLTAKSKARSDEFATRNHLPKYDYLLHPHTTGFKNSFATLQKSGLDAIIDITIAYPDVFPKTEVDFVKGKIPHEIHFHIRRYPIKDLPTDAEGLVQWLKETWKEKEQRLKYFYEHRHFPPDVAVTNGHSNGSQGSNDSVSIGLSNHLSNGVSNGVSNGNSNGVSIGQVPAKHTTPTDNGHPGFYPIFDPPNGLFFAMIFYIFYVSLGVYMTICHFWFYLMTGVPGLLYMIYRGRYSKGIDYHELELYREQIARAKAVPPLV